MKSGQTYMRNLEAISRVDSGLVEWLLKGSEDPDIVAGENLYALKGGRAQVPYYEGKPSVDKEKGRLESMDLSAGSLTCLIGIGLGYTAKAILESMDRGHIMIIVEPNPHILRLSLKTFDFSEHLISQNLFFLRPDGESIRELLVKLIGGGTVHGEFHIIPDPRSLNLFPEYKDFISQIQLAFHFATNMLSGAAFAAKEMIGNELNNLLPTAMSCKLAYLKETFGKRPVLIIGAGPSLSESIHWIARLKDRMVLIAFAASWRNLLSHGIKPHILVSSDKNVESVGMLKNTKHAQDIPLVCSSRTNAAFVREFIGPRFIVPERETSGEWLFGEIPEAVCLHAGTSVANFTFELADYLGGNPLVFTGLDLAIDEYSHTEGHPFRAKISESLQVYSIRGIGGTFVKTQPHLCTIRENLELQVTGVRSPVINATASGARIEGTEEVTLEEMGERLPPMEPVHEIKAAKLPLHRAEISALVSKLSLFLKEAEPALGECKAGIGLAKRVGEGGAETGSSDHRLIGQLNRHTANIEKLIEGHPVLQSYMGEILYRAKVENTRIAAEKDEGSKLRMELQKNRSALESVEIDLKRLTDQVKTEMTLLQRLHAHLTKLHEERVNPSVLYEYALFLFENSLCDEAVGELEKALSRRERFREALFLLGRIRIKQGLHSEARGLVEKAVALKGESGGGKTLLKKIEKEIGELLQEKQKALQEADRITSALISQEVRRSGHA